MNKKHKWIIKTISCLLIFTLLSEEIARAEFFSLLTKKSDLQPQYFADPIDDPALQNESYIKFTLQYILENMVHDMGSFDKRIFDQKLIDGKGFVFNFREDPQDANKGKRKEGENWVIPCVIGDMDEIRHTRFYSWPYEAVVSKNKEVLYIREGPDQQKTRKSSPAKEQEALPPQPYEEPAPAGSSEAKINTPGHKKIESPGTMIFKEEDRNLPFEIYGSCREKGASEILLSASGEGAGAELLDASGDKLLGGKVVLPASFAELIRISKQLVYAQPFHDGPFEGVVKDVYGDGILEFRIISDGRTFIKFSTIERFPLGEEIEFGTGEDQWQYWDKSNGNVTGTVTDSIYHNGTGRIESRIGPENAEKMHASDRYKKIYPDDLAARFTVGSGIKETAGKNKGTGIGEDPETMVFKEEGRNLAFEIYGSCREKGASEILLSASGEGAGAELLDASGDKLPGEKVVLPASFAELIRISKQLVYAQPFHDGPFEGVVKDVYEDGILEFRIISDGRTFIKFSTIERFPLGEEIEFGTGEDQWQYWDKSNGNVTGTVTDSIYHNGTGRIESRIGTENAEKMHASDRYKKIYPDDLAARFTVESEITPRTAQDKRTLLDKVTGHRLGRIPIARILIAVWMAVIIRAFVSTVHETSRREETQKFEEDRPRIHISEKEPAKYRPAAAADLGSSAPQKNDDPVEVSHDVDTATEETSGPAAGEDAIREEEDVKPKVEEEHAVPEEMSVSSLSANEQLIFPDSPLAITVIATHIEHEAPAGLPRQTGEKDKSKQDPADFIHVRNISDHTVNLSEFSLADSSGKIRNIGEFAAGKDIYLESGREIRIVWSGDDISKTDLALLRGAMVIIPEGLDRKGETVVLYDNDGRAVAGAKSAHHPQDGVTTFSVTRGHGIIKADPEVTKADGSVLSAVSHYLEDFNRPEEHDTGTDVIQEKKRERQSILEPLPSDPEPSARQEQVIEYGLSEMLEEVLRDGYQIKQAEERVRVARLRRRLAGSGTLFWDLMLRYGAADSGEGSRSLGSAIRQAQEDALRLSDDQRRVERRESSLDNDLQQLQTAQAKLHERREALENDLRQLENALNKGDDDRTAQEEAEIERDIERIQASLDRIAQEEAEIAEGIQRLQEARGRAVATEEQLEDDLNRLKRLREPELRLRSSLGIVLLDPDISRDIASKISAEKQSQVSMEMVKIDTVSSVVRLYAGIVRAVRDLEILERYLNSLEALRERSITSSLTAEEAATLEMRIAGIKSDLASRNKDILDLKTELKFIMGWSGQEQFALNESEISQEDLARILGSAGVDMELYLSMLLAERSEEIDLYQALVPSGIFKYLGVSVEALWQEDILRRTLYEGLRSPSFIGLRSSSVFGDPARAKESKMALLAYLKAIDEYRLLERTLATSARRARNSAKTFSEGHREQSAIADRALSQLKDLEIRYETGLEDMMALLRGLDETREAELEREAMAELSAGAVLDLMRAQGTVKMELDSYDADALKKMIDLMKRYRRHLRRERAQEPDGIFSRIMTYLPNTGTRSPINLYRRYLRGERHENSREVWGRVRKYLPELIMPLSERHLQSYMEEIETFRKYLRNNGPVEREYVDKLASYIKKDLSVGQRKDLEGLIERFKAGRWTLGNFIRRKTLKKEQVEDILKRIQDLVPVLGMPDDASYDQKKDFMAEKMPYIITALEKAGYSVKTPSIVEMFEVAAVRGKMLPFARDVETASVMAEDDVKLFRPVVGVSLPAGLSGDIFDPEPGDISGESLKRSIVPGISFTIPLYSPSRKFQRDAGREFILSARIEYKRAERDLKVGIARQLINIRSMIQRYQTLERSLEDLDERIKTMEARPDVPGVSLERLKRQRDRVLLELEYAAINLETERNGLKDIMGLEEDDVVMLDDITESDIEKILEKLKAGLDGNFVLSSGIETVPAGSMVTVGPDAQLAVDNVITDLKVTGTKDIHVIALMDAKNNYIGQLALHESRVVSSDVRSIKENSRVSIGPGGAILVAAPGETEMNTAQQIRAGDVSTRHLVSLSDTSGEKAGEMLIDQRTGEEALNIAFHRAQRRAYALSSMALNKEGNSFSIEFSVSPLESAGTIGAVYPRLPDSWLDWKALGWFNVPGFLTGASARQERRDVLSNIARHEARKRDIQARKAEEIAAGQKESAVKIYGLTEKQLKLAERSLEACSRQISVLSRRRESLSDPRILERMKNEKIALAAIRGRVANNLANIRILLSALGVEGPFSVSAPAQDEQIGLDEVLDAVGNRLEDELTRIDEAIAEEVLTLESLAHMFGNEINWGPGIYRQRTDGSEEWQTTEDISDSVSAHSETLSALEAGSRENPDDQTTRGDRRRELIADLDLTPTVDKGTFFAKVNLRFQPEVYGSAIARRNAENRTILSELSIETARRKVTELYGRCAAAFRRVAAEEAKVRSMAELTRAVHLAENKEEVKKHGLEAANIGLDRAKMDRIEAQKDLAAALAELSLVIENRTGIFVDPLQLAPENGIYIDASELKRIFEEDMDPSADRNLRRIRNLREISTFRGRQAWWTLLPSLSATAEWHSGADGPNMIYEASVRILGSGRILRASIARAEARSFERAASRRVKELQYEWDLIMNDLDLSLTETRRLKKDLEGIEGQIKYITGQKLASHMLGGRNVPADLRRMIEAYEDLRSRYFEANLRLNISYALAVSMIESLGVGDTVDNILSSTEIIDGASSVSDQKGTRTVPAPGPKDKLSPESGVIIAEDMPVKEDRSPERMEDETPLPSRETIEKRDGTGHILQDESAELPTSSASEAGEERTGVERDTPRTETPGVVVCGIKPLERHDRFTILEIKPEGQFVKQGDLVLKFDTSAMERDLDAENIRLNQTEIRIREAEERIREALLREEALKARYQRQKKAALLSVETAREAMARAKERTGTADDIFILLRENANAVKDLMEKNAATRFEYNDALEKLNETDEIRNRAEIDMAIARRTLEEAKSSLELVEARMKIETVRLDGIIERAESSKKAAAGIKKEISEKIDTLTSNIANSAIYADRDGEVVYSNVRSAYLAGFPVRPAEETTMGPGVAIVNGQEILRIIDAADRKRPDSRDAERDAMIASNARTGYSGRQGSIGLPVKHIVREGTYVNKGDMIALLDDSVMVEALRQEKIKLAGSSSIAAGAASLLEETRKTIEAYTGTEYSELVNIAKARRNEAISVLEAKERKVVEAGRRVSFLRKRLEEASSEEAHESLTLRIRTAYYVSLLEERTALYERELARSEKISAENALTQLEYEHTIRLARMRRDMNTARETLTRAEENEAIHRRRVEFYRAAIADCSIRADSAGRVSYLHDQQIAHIGENLNPKEEELIVGQGAIIRPGVPFVKITPADGRGGSKRGHSAIEQDEKLSRSAEKQEKDEEPVLCQIRPLSLYSRAGYGSTLKYTVPEGTIVEKNEVIARFDTSSLEREKDNQEKTLNRVRIAIVEAEKELNDAIQQKKAAEWRYDKEKDAAGTTIKHREDMLAMAEEQYARAEANVSLVNTELERLTALQRSGVRLGRDMDELSQRIYDAEISGSEAMIAFAEAGRNLAEARSELAVLEARTERENARLEGNIQRARADLAALKERLSLETERLNIINSNIDNATVRAVKAGRVLYTDHVGIPLLGWDINPVPRTVVTGAGAVVGYGQEFMRLVDPAKASYVTAPRKSEEDQFLIGTDVSLGYEGGEGAIYPTIKTVNVRDGEMVEEGQVLLELETSVLQRLMSGSEIRLLGSRRIAIEASSLLAKAEKSLTLYREKEYPALEKRAEALLKESETDFDMRKENRLSAERIAELRHREIEALRGSASNDESGRIAVARAERALNTAIIEKMRAFSLETEAFLRKLTRQAELAKLRHEREEIIGSLERDVDAAREKLKIAEENESIEQRTVDFYRNSMAKSVIKAPVSGRVVYMNEMPFNILGTRISRLPRERVIARGSRVGPGPLMRIEKVDTLSGRSDDTSPPGRAEKEASGSRFSENGDPVECGVAPLSFGRRGETGTMILEIAPEGRVKKGQLLVRFDISEQERRLEEARKLRNEAILVSSDSGLMLKEFRNRKELLEYSLRSLRGILESNIESGITMSGRAREAGDLSAENAELAKKQYSMILDLLSESTGLFMEGVFSLDETNRMRILMEEENMSIRRAIMELTQANLIKEKGEIGIEFVISGIERELGIIDRFINMAKENLEAAQAKVRPYSDMIERIENNIRNSKIYAEQDGWVMYEHNTGSSFIGVPIETTSVPAYIGQGAMVRNGQSVMRFFSENAAIGKTATQYSPDPAIHVNANVWSGQRDLTGPRGARILSVPKKNGDLVNKGEVILVLDASELEDMKSRAVSALRASIREAERYSSLRRGSVSHLKKYISEEYPARLRYAEALRDEAAAVLEGARNAVVLSARMVRVKKDEYEKLKKSGVATEAELDLSLSALNRANIDRKRALYNLESAQNGLKKAMKGIEILSFNMRRKVAELEARIGVAGEKEKIVLENIGIDEALIRYYERQIENCVIRAPSAGRIHYNTAVNYRMFGDRRVPRELIITPGYEVAPGATIAKITDASAHETVSPRHPPVGVLSFFLILAGLARSMHKKWRSIKELGRSKDPRHIGPYGTGSEKTDTDLSAEAVPLQVTVEKDPQEKERGKRAPPKGPVKLAMLAFLTLPFMGCAQGGLAGSIGITGPLAPIFEGYSSLVLSYPSIAVLVFAGSAAIYMIASSYLFVLGKKSKKESAGTLQSFAKRPGIFISLVLGLILGSIFPGLPSGGAWSEAIEVLKIVTAAAVFVTYPLNMVSTFITGFFRGKTMLRVRMPFFSFGIVKLRSNSVSMDREQAIKRLLKWWAMFAAAWAFLSFVMPAFISIPSSHGPGLSYGYVAGAAMELYRKIASTNPFVDVIRWGMVVTVVSSIAEYLIKLKTHFLRDEYPDIRKMFSRLSIMGAAAVLMTALSPFLPYLMTLPGYVSPVHFLQALEVLIIFLIPVTFYLNMGSYFLGLFTRRVHRVYQSPTFLGFLVVRHRSHLPRLIYFSRKIAFAAGLMIAGAALSVMPGASMLPRALSWYGAFSLRHPGIAVLSWLGVTVFSAMSIEILFEKAKEKYRHLREKYRDKNVKGLAFLAGGAVTSLFFVSFPPLAAWSHALAWAQILVVGSAVIGLPLTIISAFFLGIPARVLFIRTILPFVPNVKTRIRELELPQSEAILKLINIWKWLIAAGAGLLYAAPLIFTPGRIGGVEHHPVLRLARSKAIDWAGAVAQAYPFTKAVAWLGTIVLIAAMIEIAIKRYAGAIPDHGRGKPGLKANGSLRVLVGDEYMVNRLAAKIPAVGGALIAAGVSAWLLSSLSGAGSAFSIFAVSALGASELLTGAAIRHIRAKTPDRKALMEKLAKIKDAAKKLSLVFIGTALVFAGAHLPGADIWSGLLPATGTAAGILGIASLYFMVSSFVLGIFTSRINQVIQSLYIYFFVVVRWRAKFSPMTMVKTSAWFSAAMFATAYLSFSGSVISILAVGIGMAGVFTLSILKWWRTQIAFRDAGLTPNRREEKFELENANGEPGLVRDMMEAHGMVPDRKNPMGTYYGNHSLYLDTPGYRWKGLGYFSRHPLAETRSMLKAYPGLLTYFARESSYREYRFKARIRWYDNVEKTKEVHLEIKNRLDTRMWKFECWARSECIPEILALTDADSEGRVDYNWLSDKYVNKLPDQASLSELYKYITENGLVPRQEYRNKRIYQMDTFSNESFVILNAILPFALEYKSRYSSAQKERNDPAWEALSIPPYNGFMRAIVNLYEAQVALEEFCSYVRTYGLEPTVQVSYERLAYENPSNAEELLNRLVPLALEYRRRIQKGQNAPHWKTVLASPSGKYLRAILASFEKWAVKYPGREAGLSDELIALSVEHRKRVKEKQDAKAWLSAQDSPAAKYLYALLHPEDPENPEIKVDKDDVDYLRMTLDMNVRWRQYDNPKDPTLFMGDKGFRRTWPGKTILEVKYRGQKAAGWVYRMVEAIDEIREEREINQFPVRRQPAGKYCDSVSIWLYWKLLRGDFGVRTLRQFVLRLLGLDTGYPVSPRSPQWAGFTGPGFEDVFGIGPDKTGAHEAPYGMEPLGYAYRGHVFPASYTPDTDGSYSHEYEDGPSPVPAAPVAGPSNSDGSGTYAADNGKTESVTYNAAPEEAARAEIRYRLLEASGDEDFARAFADAVFSFYREKRDIVFAFDVSLGGGQGTKALELLTLIQDLKADHRYARFLDNIEMIRFDPSRGEKGLRSLRERTDSGALVFSFAKDNAQARKNLSEVKNDPNVKMSFIDEQEVSSFLLTEIVYYPLFEVVTIALARYIDEMTIEDIKEIGREVAIKAREEEGMLIFTLLPSIKRFDTNREILQYYAFKKKLLIAA
jgi:multidrug efflux pump subunit AcrA (membrane-fusion protein)/outer membrane protein TolC